VILLAGVDEAGTRGLAPQALLGERARGYVQEVANAPLVVAESSPERESLVCGGLKSLIHFRTRARLRW
jgi:hypothetical protein